MSTITAILESDADGTVHIPVPPELRHGKLHVIASIESISEAFKTDAEPRRTLRRATPEMIAKRMAAVEALRAAGGLSSVIPDPSAWQREIREDRAFPGRD